jgi:alpha/beta superfamily hydrolase
MNSHSQRVLIPGPAGDIECLIDEPSTALIGTAVVCHPHPQHGGSMDNKVVQTLARCFLQLGLRSVRFNFRGVGASQGQWDQGVGELADARAVVAAHTEAGQVFMLAGFSFGGFVAAQVAHELPQGAKPLRLVLVGPSTQKQQLPAVPADTVVVHGEADEVVPLSSTFDWARPQALPVVVLPGVGHFFHGQLALLKHVVLQQLRGAG